MKQLKIAVGICDGYTVILQINGGNHGEYEGSVFFLGNLVGSYIHYKIFYL